MHTYTRACTYMYIYLCIWVYGLVPQVYIPYTCTYASTHISIVRLGSTYTHALYAYTGTYYIPTICIYIHTHTYALYAYTHAPYPYTCTCTIRLHIHVYAYMPCTYTCTYRVWVYECVACPLCRAYVQCGLCDVLRSSDWAWCHNMQWSCYLAMTRMHVFLVSGWLAAS